ncbi:hypothetical protein HDU87_006902 [Geranomyces variabilis]|uniref:Uncharacterized protein n=1 Tax=Geranomyces variabilis TaxID=109894 RepID=A0AAD5TEX2_9FUNG|nr:hypothetical protein HDU87_006902 [Geranomyces variabilis]
MDFATVVGIIVAKHIIAAGERSQGALAPDFAANQNANSAPVRSLERRAFKDINTKDPDVTYGTYYTQLSTPAYGLWIWSNLARNMRVSLRNGGTHIPFPASTSSDGSSSDGSSLDITQFYSQPVLMYLIKAASWTSTEGPVQQPTESAAIAGGLSGSDYFGKSITILQVSADKIFTDTSNTFDNVNGAVDNTFSYILTTVNSTADSAAALIPMGSASAVATSITTMADSCDATETALTALQTASTAFQGLKTSLSADGGLVSQVITTINSITSSVHGLNTYQTAPGGTIAYKLHNVPPDPITTNLDSTRTAMRDHPSLSQIVNTVVQSMPDLTSIASSSRNAAIKATAQNQLAPVQSDISQQFTSIKATINDKQDQFNQYTPYITQAQLYRLIGATILFCLPALILFSVLFSVTARKPGVVKCCLCGSIPYTLLAVFLTILILLLSWIAGEVCTIAFDRSVNGTAPMVDLLEMIMGNGTATSYSKAMAARESCLQGDSIMTAINFFVDTSQFDVTSGATSAIMSLDLTGITSSLDLSSILGTSQSPTSATSLADNLISDLSQYTITDITDLQTAVSNANAALTATLNSIPNPAADSDLDMQSAASGTERSIALTDLQNRIAAVRQTISDFQGSAGTLGQALAALTALTTSPTDFPTIMTMARTFDSNADNIAPDFQDVATKIANFVSDAEASFSAGVPQLQQGMIAAVTTAQNKILKMNVTCQDLATDTVNLEMGLCDGLLTGGDSFWFAFFILCSGGAMSVPAFISAANVLADRESGRPKGEAGSGKTKKAFDTGKPKEKGKGKGKDDVEAGQIKWSAPGANTPGAGPGEHFQVSKSAMLSPSDAMPGSPERSSQPDSARIYPEVQPDLPGYNAEGGVRRAPSDAKRPFSVSNPSGAESPRASPRVSQQGAPHSYANAASQRQSVQMHAYAPEDDNIQEMRPSWLGGGPGGSAGPSDHNGETSGSFSPRARHPYQPVSPADSYLDSNPDGSGAPQQQYAHPHPPAANNSRRVSAAQHPGYEHVVTEFSKRVSQHPPAHVYDDRGYQVPPPQPYYEQPEQPQYGNDEQYDEYGRPRY